MKNSIFIFFLIITSIIACQCSAQHKHSPIYKLEISDTLNLYFRNKKDHIVEQSKDSTKVMLHNFKAKNAKFYDYPKNDNFTLYDGAILHLKIWKECLTCYSEKDFLMTSWGIRFECRDLQEKGHPLLGYIPSVFPLDIKNRYSILGSKNQIYFDFLHVKDDILMLILADNVLHVYENIGKVDNNQWQLVKSYPSQLQVPFRTYINDKDEIIILFDSENIFYANLTKDYLERVRQTVDDSQCLIYDHSSKKYLWITQKEASTLLQSKNPDQFINTKLKSNED